ncbi:MAG: molybdenum cofactor guanylyltransferase, partial [Desulfofustis sp.]|nr:molybdenum cofactor guanylyltransferase [Desulfofustis sp.]
LTELVECLAACGIKAGWLEETVLHENEASRRQICRAFIAADLVLVAGHPGAASAELWLGNGPSGPSPSESRSDSRFFCADQRELASCTDALARWLRRCSDLTPVWGCVLIGGRSSRMGHPKHLLTGSDGRTWLEHTVERLRPFVAGCVISGGGIVPDTCQDLERISDLPGVVGPLAGIGAVVRQRPWTSWLVLACDLPDVSSPAIAWLLQQRRVGTVAVIPVNPVNGYSEPLFAWYDFRCAPLLDDLLAGDMLRISSLRGHPAVHQPSIPLDLCGAWRNVNRVEEL